MQATAPTATLKLVRASRVERVLIYRLGSLGDILIALPALHLVDRAFPGAEVRETEGYVALSGSREALADKQPRAREGSGGGGGA